MGVELTFNNWLMWWLIGSTFSAVCGLIFGENTTPGYSNSLWMGDTIVAAYLFGLLLGPITGVIVVVARIAKIISISSRGTDKDDGA